MNGVTVSPVNMKERAELGIRAGDTVRVWQKIEEKGKTRLQAFEGLVLARKHGSEAGGTFTVRKIASGVGVEKIFPLHSPMIDKIEIVKRAKVRRAKLYFVRDKVAREVKRLLRRTTLMGVSTKGATELAEERKRAETAETERQDTEEKRAEEEEKKVEARSGSEDAKEAESTEGEEEEKENQKEPSSSKATENKKVEEQETETPPSEVEEEKEKIDTDNTEESDEEKKKDEKTE